MKIVSIKRIDGFGGDQLSGNPKTGDVVRITYDNGAVVEKHYVAPPTPEQKQYVYLHVNITDGDGGTPIGIKNDGTDYATITATLRAGEDPESQAITAIDNVPWRVTIRNSTGGIYDIIKTVFNLGVAVVQYTTQYQPDLISLQQRDLYEKVGGADIALVGDARIKVYRDFTN